jgi:hypothetical protein
MTEDHRLTNSLQCSIYNIEQPFSCFELVEKSYQALAALHRCFSLGRAFGAKTLIVEKIPETGFIRNENDELRILFPSYLCQNLLRFSFWTPELNSQEDMKGCNNEHLIGYVIVKCDAINKAKGKWHIFESVFRKYSHKHNCVPCQSSYKIAVCGQTFIIPGILYCQQNSLNKVCAHVALRSLLSRLTPEGDLDYLFMNKIARSITGASYKPSDGLSVEHIQQILTKLKIPYSDLDYAEVRKKDPDIRQSIPYQKFLYAGIESGCGGLLGFKMDGPRASSERHIIPFYGHTFNKDTWTPDADAHYFNIGGGIGYIPSESWTSSFIGHDDNFGQNFCVPRLYVKPSQAEYVVELQKPLVKYGGMIAEAQSLQFLYSVTPHLNVNSEWSKRLAFYSQRKIQKVVLRAVCIEKEKYLAHLGAVNDWDGNREDSSIIDVFSKNLPKILWVIEISLPQLFPANERKLGDIVMNATRTKNENIDVDYNLFLFARLPSQYIMQNGNNQHAPSFVSIPSSLISHVDLIYH